MKCQEIQQLLSEYEDGTLSDLNRKRVEQHLDECTHCREESIVWRESREWILREKSHYMNVQGIHSVADLVMSRIMAEEKWAFFGKRIVTISSRLRKWGMSAAVILLLVSCFHLVIQSGERYESVSNLPPAKPQVISSSLETTEGLDPFAVPNEMEITVEKESASIIEPLDDSETSAHISSLPIAVGVIGLILTILSLSWFNRV